MTPVTNSSAGSHNNKTPASGINNIIDFSERPKIPGNKACRHKTIDNGTSK
jgi:hypothetical protein